MVHKKKKKNTGSIFFTLNKQLTHFLNSKTIQNSFSEFFATNPLCQLLDQTNPLSELTHKRRLSSLGLGGINRETAGMEIRGIHPTHYGRICPIETTEGQNAGLVNSFTIYSQLNENGFIETPFYKAYKGMIFKNNPFFFASDQEKQLRLAPGDIITNKFNFLPNISIPCRQLKEFKRLSRESIDFIAVSPLQMISIATSLIPFLEHDDGNRALMGSNMQRQSVPTLQPNLPIVGTGLESKVIADINHGVQIKKAGFVSDVEGKQIIIYSQFQGDFISNGFDRVDSFPFKNTSPLVSRVKKTKKPVQGTNQRSHYEWTNRAARPKSKATQKLQTQRVQNLLNQPQQVQHQNTLGKRCFFKSGVYQHINKKAYFTVLLKHQLEKNLTLKRVKKQFGLTYVSKMNHYRLKKPTNACLLNSIQMFTMLNLAYTNGFLKNWKLLTYFSTQPIYKSSFGLKPFLNKKNLYHLNQFYNKIVLLNYIKLLLIHKFTLPQCKPCIPVHNKQLSNTKPYTKKSKQSINSTRFPMVKQNKKGVNFFLKSFLFLSLFLVFNVNRHKTPVFKTKVFLLNTNVPCLFYKKKSVINVINPFALTTVNHLTINKTSTFLIPFRLCSRHPYNRHPCSRQGGFPRGWVHSHPTTPLRGSMFSKLYQNNKQKKICFYHSFFYHQKSFEFSVAEKTNKQDYYLVNFDFNQNQIQNTKTNLLYHGIKNKQNRYFPVLNNLLPVTYGLDSFSRSNQDTYLTHRPIIKSGVWVEKNDIIADNSACKQGQLAVGQNLLIAYMPWQGYNFEDAVVLSENVVSKDLFTTLHIERYELEIRDTPFGKEQITNQLPETDTSYLDPFGIVKLGSWVQSGDILVGKITPIEKKKLSAYEALLYDIIEKKNANIKDSSLRVPFGVHGRVIHIEIFREKKKRKQPKKSHGLVKSVRNKKSNPLQLNQKKLKKITSTSLKKTWVPSWGRKHIPKKIHDQKNQSHWFICNKLTNDLFNVYQHHWIPKINQTISKNVLNRLNNANMSFLNVELENTTKKNKQKKGLPSGKGGVPAVSTPLFKVHVYIAEKKKIQIGDKIAGRHGNKGIISTILPQQDMPYLPDGTPVDLILNPLGVPSRMNVGQIFECLLGLAGYYLGQHYKIQPFDEMYGYEASRSLVYSKLYEAKIKTGQNWLFNPNFPGKIRLFDGRTGQCFDQPVTVGYSYILKLIHLVDEKIHARSTGPYALVTQQPLRGRSNRGGQRVGEMEVWAFEGFGAAYILQELLTIKSDDIKGRDQVSKSILTNQPLTFGTPESFKVLLNELQALCLDISIYKVNKKAQSTHIPLNLL